MHDGSLEHIPLEMIATSDNTREVDTETVKYQDMKESIRVEGILTPLLVRRLSTPSGVVLDLVAGHHRLKAAEELGFKEIPCKVIDEISDEDKLKLQVQENVHRTDLNVIQLAAAMHDLIAKDPERYTVNRLSQEFHLRPDEVKRILKLHHMCDEAKLLVERGHIKVMNAVQLSKLDGPKQRNYLDQAREMTTVDFKEFLKHIVKREKTLHPKVRDEEYTPHPKLRKISLIKAELEKPEFAKKLVKDMNPEEAFLEGIRFCISLDSITAKKRQDEFERAFKEEQQRKKQRKRDRVAQDLEKQQAKIRELRAKMEQLEDE